MTETKQETFDRFTITNAKGFSLQFENGWAVSVQWGPGNYADVEGGRMGDLRAPMKAAADYKPWRANSAEVAVLVPDARATEETCGRFLKGIGGCDDVAGWVNADKVAVLLATVAAFKADTPDTEALACVQGVIETE